MPRGDYSSLVSGDVEWRIENAFLDIIENNLDVGSVFNSDTVNVRVAKDTTAGDRAFPAIAIEATVSQSIPNTNEYRCLMRFFCETDGHMTDKSGEQVKALLGALRDILHADDIIDQINDQQRGIQMNSADSLHEGAAEDDSENEGGNFVRRMVLQADAWVYVGRAS